MNDETEIRTKVYHLPAGGRVTQLNDMREQRAAQRLEIKKDRRKRAWIRGLIAWNVIMWTITAVYYTIYWGDIFR